MSIYKDIAAVTVNTFFHYPLVSVLSRDYNRTVDFITECISVYVDSQTERKEAFTVLTVSRTRSRLCSRIEEMLSDHPARMGRSKVAHEFLWGDSTGISLVPIQKALKQKSKKSVKVVLIDEYSMFDLEKGVMLDEYTKLYSDLRHIAVNNNVLVITINGFFESTVAPLSNCLNHVRTQQVDGEFKVFPNGKNVEVVTTKARGTL